MDNKIYMYLEKGKVTTIKFRGKHYKVEDENSIETYKKIAKEHSDFEQILYDATEQNSIVFKKLLPKDLRTRLAAIGLAGTMLAGLAIFAACSKNNKQDANSDVSSTEYVSIDENTPIEEYLSQLQEGIQRDSWAKINDFQNYFNNTAAPSISIEEDNGAQLYLTAEQCIALFTRMNADRLTAEEMASIFGNSSYYTFANLDANFNEACKILNYYYLTATEKSGLDIMFVDESDKTVFIGFEQLVLNYNANRSEENKQILHDTLINDIFLNTDLNGPKETNKGACSIIGTAIVPILNATRVIDAEELETLTEINETITCDELKKHVQEAATKKEEISDKNQSLLEILPDILDQYNIKVENLNIDFEARYQQVIAEIYGEEYAYGNGSIYNDTNNVTSSYTEINQTTTVTVVTEEEAVEQFEEEYQETNNYEEIYGKGLNAVTNSSLYDEVYNYVAQNGMKPTASTFAGTVSAIKNSYSGSNTAAFLAGVDAGIQNTINNGYNDAMPEYNARNNNTPKYDTEEEYIPEEKVETIVPTVAPTETPVSTPEPIPVATQTPSNSEIVVEEEYIPQEELEQIIEQPAAEIPVAEEPAYVEPVVETTPYVAPVSEPAPIVETPVYEVSNNETFIVEEEYITQEELEEEGLVRTRH